MKVFYAKSIGRSDVAAESPAEVPFEIALEIFRGLDSRSGFLGVELEERFVLQMAHEKSGRVRVELLDTTIPAFDACEADCVFAESLSRAAAEEKDVFKLAHDAPHDWEHLDMS